MALRRTTASLQPGPVDRIVTAVLARRRGGPVVRRWRRIVALMLLVTAGALAVRESEPTTPGQDVVAVATDLPVGAVLTTDDLELVRIDPPDGAVLAVDQADGRVLTGPIRRGEVLTDARLLPADGPDPGLGRVAVPVTPGDPALVGLLSPGMRVAVVGLPPEGIPTVLSEDALVIAISDVADERTARPVVLGIPAGQADAVTQATLLGDVTFRFV